MEHPDDVVNPAIWLGSDSDGFWSELLSMVFGGQSWPEGSESAIWELSEEWAGLAESLAAASEEMQTAAAGLLEAWDAPAAQSVDSLARQLLGSPDVGLPGHVQNISAMAQQLDAYGVELQYAKISINVAMAVAVIAAVISIITTIVGGLGTAGLGAVAATARQAVSRALQQLLSAAGRRALVRDLGAAVVEQGFIGTVRRGAEQGLSRAAGHHLRDEIIEEVVEEVAIDVVSQGIQVSEGTRTDYNTLSTLTAALGGGAGGALGAGLVAPVFGRLRSTDRLTALAGSGRGGTIAQRVGNVGIRHTGGLAATAATNVVASPGGSIVASVLTGQGFPALSGDMFLAAAAGAAGRYNTVSPFSPAVMSAAVHPASTLANAHNTLLAAQTLDAARAEPAGAVAPATGAETATSGDGDLGKGAVPGAVASPAVSGATGGSSSSAGGAAPTGGAGTSGGSAPGSQSSPSSSSTSSSSSSSSSSSRGATAAANSQPADSAGSSTPGGTAASPAPADQAGVPQTEQATDTSSPTPVESPPAAQPASTESQVASADGQPAVTDASSAAPDTTQTAADTQPADDVPGDTRSAGNSDPAPAAEGSASPSSAEDASGAVAPTTNVAAERTADSAPPTEADPSASVVPASSRSAASLDRLTALVAADAASRGQPAPSRAEVERALVTRALQAEVRKASVAQATERARHNLAARRQHRRGAIASGTARLTPGRQTSTSTAEAAPVDDGDPVTQTTAATPHGDEAPREQEAAPAVHPETRLPVAAGRSVDGPPPGDGASGTTFSNGDWQARRDQILAEVRAEEQRAFESLPSAARELIGSSVAAASVRADQVMAELKALLTEVAPDSDLVGTDHRVKQAGSVARVVARDLARTGMPGLRVALSSLGDAVRFSVQTPHVGYADHVEAVLNGLRAQGALVTSKNFWGVGNRFLGLNVTVVTSDGPFELQFPTEASFAAGKTTHGDYEIYRLDPRVLDLPAGERFAALGRVYSANDGAGISTDLPDGVDRLGPVKPTDVGTEVRKAPRRITQYQDELAGRDVARDLVARGVVADVAEQMAQEMRGDARGSGRAPDLPPIPGGGRSESDQRDGRADVARSRPGGDLPLVEAPVDVRPDDAALVDDAGQQGRRGSVDVRGPGRSGSGREGVRARAAERGGVAADDGRGRGGDVRDGRPDGVHPAARRRPGSGPGLTPGTPTDRGPDVLVDSHGHGTTNAQALVEGTEVPMTLESVRLVAERLGLDLAGVDVRVNVDVHSVEWYDHAGGMASTGLVDGAPQIIFAPASFLTEETLVRTVAHEMEHVEQYRHDRVESDLANGSALGAEAYGIEDDALDTYQEAAGGHQDSRGEGVPAVGEGNGDLGTDHGGGRLHRGCPGRGGNDGPGAGAGLGDARSSTGDRPAGRTGDVPGGRSGGDGRIGAGLSEAGQGSGLTEGVSAETPGPSDGPPPSGPPSSEQELFDSSPEALRRFVLEAVSNGQVVADDVLGQLTAVLDHLEEQGFPRPDTVGLENAVKTLWSAARKIQPVVQGGSTVADAFWSMDDLVRFSVQTDPSRYGDSVLETLEAFRSLGWSVPHPPADGEEAHEDWRNTWAEGNRHHGLLVVITDGTTGQRVEIQFPTAESWAVGKKTHGLYETLRYDDDNPMERVVALARIRDVVVAEHVEQNAPQGLEKLGEPKPNGPARIFRKEPELAAGFILRAENDAGTALAALLEVGISEPTARVVAKAAYDAVRGAISPPEVHEEASDDGTTTPGLGNLGTDSPAAPGALGTGGGTVPGAGSAGAPSLQSPPRGSGAGAPRSSGADGGRGDREGEGLRLPDRHLAEGGHQAGPGHALEAQRRAGDRAVQRAERDVDLRPGERERDGAPGGRGPVRAAGAGDPGRGGSGGPQEGDDAADARTPAGDLPDAGGPGDGDVGDAVGPGAVQEPHPGELTGPLAVGADADEALAHVLTETAAQVVARGAEDLPLHTLLLADGSTVDLTTGVNPWARTDDDRPLQMWTVGRIHLDPGPLTPAGSRFLTDLMSALQDAGAGPLPLSQWLAQRATLDPRTHKISESGVARPHDSGGDVRVWDAGRGWVAASAAGGLARVVDEGLVAADEYAAWTTEPTAAEVLTQAAFLAEVVLEESLGAEVSAALQAGTPEYAAAVEARARQRTDLVEAAAEWAVVSVPPALALFLRSGVQVLAVSRGRLLVELDGGALAVVAVATAEAQALPGSRPGLIQAGTTADIGRFRNELDVAEEFQLARQLTGQLQQGAVRHFRVQGVLAGQDFVGTRVTEFEVLQPAHDVPGMLRPRVDPQRYVDPGPGAREAMARALAGWTPASTTDAIQNALRWLPFVNPHVHAFPAGSRMPWSNNCGDCSRAVADLVQGRDARTAFGDNAARVGWDLLRHGSTDPGELREMFTWAGTTPRWHDRGTQAPVAAYTTDSYARIGQLLAGEPAGTAAIVLVNWADDAGTTKGGHWFNAVVTEQGVQWVDGQTAQHRSWPPPYRRSVDGVQADSPINGWSVITRAQGSDTWLDLDPGGAQPTGTTANQQHDGESSLPTGEELPGGGAGGPPAARATGRWAADRGPTGLSRGVVDPTFATRMANATGWWPDDEDELPGIRASVHREAWTDGRGMTSSATVTVRSPGGQELPLSVRWIERADGPPVLVLSEVAGQPFWWGAPDAVLQAVDRAFAALRPDPGGWGAAVVLGQRHAPDGSTGLARFDLDLDAARSPRFSGPSRALSPAETAGATRALRLDVPFIG